MKFMGWGKTQLREADPEHIAEIIAIMEEQAQEAEKHRLKDGG